MTCRHCGYVDNGHGCCTPGCPGNAAAITNEYAILYLDTLRIVQFKTRDEAKNAVDDATRAIQPHVTLRYRERAGRYCWAVQTTTYLDGH